MFYGLLHKDTPVLANQQKLTFISSVQTLDAVEKTCQARWQTEMDSEKESKESVLLACHDDGDDLLSGMEISQGTKQRFLYSNQISKNAEI